MSVQSDTKAPHQAHAATASKAVAAVSLKMEGPLSPEQQRFNRLLVRIENLAGKIESTRALGDAHRLRSASVLPPLVQRRDQLMREMVLWLHERLQRKGLSRRLQAMACEIICSLSESFASAGDEFMRQLHDSCSAKSFSDKQSEAAAQAQAMLEQVLGVDMEGAADFASVDDVMQAGMQRLREQAEAQQAGQADSSARKPKRGPTVRQQMAEQQEQEADGALRAIYRQLASALHPDRETDPEVHAHKTALMKEANVAYARSDLMALLKLQLRIEQAEPGAVARLASDKLQALTHLLKKQVQVLQQDLRTLEFQLMDEFGFPDYATLSAATLQSHLRERKQYLQADIAAMEADLQRVLNDAQFKRWLKEQHDLAADSFDDPGLSEFF